MMLRPHTTRVVRDSRAVLSEKARSFRWAAQFLSRDQHDDAAIVYAFCRLVDDTADEAPDKDHAARGLERLRAELDGTAAARPVIDAFLTLAARRGLDLDAARELILGVATDLEPVRLPDDVALLRYCYRVASTVGLMMCAVIEVRDPSALPFAVDLGVAMQLSNICRDVAEDAAMGRVYLPATRLRFHGTSPQALLDGHAPREAVAAVVRDLLALADAYYASAEQGMRFIPPRSRAAILVASRVYRAIGVRLRQNRCDALAGRTIVPWTQKSRWVLDALARMARPHVLGLTPAPRHDRALHLALDGLPGANA